MSETKAVKYLTVVCFVLLTLAYATYIGRHMSFMSYVHRFDFDAQSVRHSYFRDLSSSPFASYYGFIGACFFIVGSFRLRKRLVGILPLILALWLTISSLDEYYVDLNYAIVVTIGAIFEVITLCIGVFILIRKENIQKQSAGS